MSSNYTQLPPSRTRIARSVSQYDRLLGPQFPGSGLSSVAHSKQVYIGWLKATALLSTLGEEDIYIGTFNLPYLLATWGLPS
jgi:hypothetical protein